MANTSSFVALLELKPPRICDAVVPAVLFAVKIHTDPVGENGLVLLKFIITLPVAFESLVIFNPPFDSFVIVAVPFPVVVIFHLSLFNTLPLKFSTTLCREAL